MTVEMLGTDLDLETGRQDILRFDYRGKPSEWTTRRDGAGDLQQDRLTHPTTLTDAETSA